MPRTQAQIWADLDVNLDLVRELQTEMNAALAPVPPDPPNPDPGSYYQYGILPTAYTSIKVDDGTKLRDALSAARPGTRIELAKQEYGGEYILSTNGEPTKPIMVHAPNGATFPGQFKIPGKWAGISNLSFKGSGRKVDISGQGGRVMRCTFPNIQYDGMIYLTGSAHPDVMIDFNLFQNIKGAAVRSEINDATMHKGMRIVYNYIKGHTCMGDNESFMLVLTDAYDAIDLIYGWNRFEDCLKEFSDQKEGISIKTGNVKVLNNTLVGCRGAFISLRETRGCQVEGNWLRDGSYIKVHGDNHDIVNNNGSGKTIEINCGNATFDTPLPEQCKNFNKAGRTPVVVKNGNCATAHTACRNIDVQDNIGEIKVGENYPDMNFKCKDIRLQYNQKKASVVNNSTDGFTETNIGEHNCTAYEMTPAMVGPNAPAPDV